MEDAWMQEKHSSGTHPHPIELHSRNNMEDFIEAIYISNHGNERA